MAIWRAQDKDQFSKWLHEMLKRKFMVSTAPPPGSEAAPSHPPFIMQGEYSPPPANTALGSDTAHSHSEISTKYRPDNVSVVRACMHT
jgi:hypothetical protein